MKLTEQHRLALAASLALAIGVPAGMVLDGSNAPDKPTLPEVAETATGKLDPSLVVDVAKYQPAIKAAKEACGPNCVDLLSAPCDPGVECATGGNFLRGARLVGDVELIGAAGGSVDDDGNRLLPPFRIDAATCEDRGEQTWCEVRATNTSSTTLRLTALVEYEAPTQP